LQQQQHQQLKSAAAAAGRPQTTLQALLLPLEGLYQQLLRLKQEKGWDIDSRLACIALGYHLAAAGSS